MIRADHGLRGRGLTEWQEWAEHLGTEQTQPMNELRDLIEHNVSAVDIVLPRLQTEEGFRGMAYKDTESHLTIGYGFNVDAGITRTAALALMRAQVQELDTSLNGYVWYATLDAVRQSVCLDIAFNAGLPGLLKFPHMIAALANKDWSTASSECRVTNPELAGRYAKLAQILLTGVT